MVENHTNVLLNIWRTRLLITMATVGLLIGLVSVVHAQRYGEWSAWHGSDAIGIDYRTSGRDYHLAAIQFRNRTEKDCSLEYTVWFSNSDQSYRGRSGARTGATSPEESFPRPGGAAIERVDVFVKR